MFFYFLIRRRISELPWPIATKLCYVINVSVDFIMQVQKFGGPSPKKFWGPKTSRFWREFLQLFDLEYLRNETRYPKSESHLIETDSSRVWRKKSGELWSTIQKAWLWVGPTQIDFRQTMFRLLGGAGPWNFYTC